jgi:hypothetical protein
MRNKNKIRITGMFLIAVMALSIMMILQASAAPYQKEIDKEYELELDKAFELELDKEYELELDKAFELELHKEYELELDKFDRYYSGHKVNRYIWAPAPRPF